MSEFENKILDLEEYVANGLPLPDIQAISGEKWFPVDTTLAEDMPVSWGGDWGCSSECNKLRAVLLHRPGAEVENFDYREVRFRAPVDPEKFRAQHDVLADYYRSHKAVMVNVFALTLLQRIFLFLVTWLTYLAFGLSGERIARDLIADPIIVKDLNEAIAKASRLAEPGDVVLLSPTTSSYDQYHNYEERGRHFKKLVNEL